MNPGQLKETTMDPATRSLIRITLPQEYEERAGVKDLVDRLMGNNPAHRFAFSQENAARLAEEAIDACGAGAARRRRTGCVGQCGSRWTNVPKNITKHPPAPTLFKNSKR